MVVIICIGKYQKLDELNGTQRDKERIKSVFKNKYNYNVIGNKNAFVTYTDVENILSTAKQKFRQKSNGYKGIIIVYSGHGDEQYLQLSDYRGIKYDDGKYKRTDFESYFNATNVKEKSDAFKIYFVDSCRGNTTSIMYPQININKKGNKNNNFRYIHPESNKCIMYSNSITYESYEVPFNVDTDDIDWQIMAKSMDGDDDEEKKLDDNIPKCGMFLNAVYHAFMDNYKTGYDTSFGDIQDNIRDKAIGVVPTLNANRTLNYQCQVGLEIDEAGNLRNKVKRNMYFKKCVKSKIRRNDNNIAEW